MTARDGVHVMAEALQLSCVYGEDTAPSAHAQRGHDEVDAHQCLLGEDEMKRKAPQCTDGYQGEH
jgi:hypothetical protein